MVLLWCFFERLEALFARIGNALFALAKKKTRPTGRLLMR
jgi:hypothetical protein